MIQRISATYVDGVFKPDEAVNLPENTQVEVIVELAPEENRSLAAWNRMKARLAERPIHGGGHRFTRDELHERR